MYHPTLKALPHHGFYMFVFPETKMVLPSLPSDHPFGCQSLVFSNRAARDD